MLKKWDDEGNGKCKKERWKGVLAAVERVKEDIRERKRHREKTE